jgi:hypothetical protein
MFIKIGNIEFNLEAELSKDDFMAIYTGVLQGVDINEAWKQFSKEKRKIKKK